MAKVIEVEHLYKSYPMAIGDPYPVLKDVNFSIEEGEFVAIMGPSGSGKSTLMNTLGCLDTPTSGVYKIGGEVVSGMNEDQLANVRSEKIGFVFQTYNLIAKTNALKNVEMPMLYGGVSGKQRVERAKELLHIVGMEDRMKHLPEELSGGQKQRVAIARAMANDPSIILADEPTGALPAELSGGEQQRVSIARALAKNPKVLLCDEPTGALDSETGRMVMDLFHKLHREQGKTIILITHSPELAEETERIITIKDGMITGERKGSGQSC